MKKFVVYTALTGGYDHLIQLSCVSPEFDYICFTDAVLSEKYCGMWKMRRIPQVTFDKQRLSRFPKMHPHLLLRDYEYSVYIDASIDIINSELYHIIIDKIGAGVILSGVRHPHRDCVYEEFFAVYRTRKDTDLNHLKKGYKYLQKYDMPKHMGLFEAGLILRKHNDERIVFQNEMWWLMVNVFSKRDQLSYTFSLWKNGIPFDYLEGVGLSKPNGYCKLVEHSDNTRQLPFFKKLRKYIYFAYIFKVMPLFKPLFYFYLKH